MSTDAPQPPSPFVSAKIRDEDHAALKELADRYGSNISEMIAVGRRLIEAASERRCVGVLRELRERDMKVSV